MRVSIIRDNATVTVDGVCYAVDVSELPSYFHAIQWDGSKGHIEFGLDAEGRHLPNLSLSLPSRQRKTKKPACVKRRRRAYDYHHRPNSALN
jgi:hypothetical protein